MINIKNNKLKNKIYINFFVLVSVAWQICFFSFYKPINAAPPLGSKLIATEASSDSAARRQPNYAYQQMRRAHTYNAIPRIQTHAEIRNNLVKNMFKTIVKALANFFGGTQNGTAP